MRNVTPRSYQMTGRRAARRRGGYGLPVLLGLSRRHEVVAIGVALDLLDRLPGVLGVQLVQRVAGLEDLPRVDVDIGRLALEAGEHLVDDHPRVRQRVALALGAGREQEAAHRAGLPHADRGDVAVQVLHGVVDRQTGGHMAARRVDVQHDVLLGLFGVEEQQLRDHHVGHVVIDRGAEEDDAILEQAGEDVPAALAAVRLLQDGWNERIHGRLHRGATIAPRVGGSDAPAPPIGQARCCAGAHAQRKARAHRSVRK
jgi:hypothetical protein